MTADEILSAGSGDHSHMLLPTAILLFTNAGIISERINRAIFWLSIVTILMPQEAAPGHSAAMNLLESSAAAHVL